MLQNFSYLYFSLLEFLLAKVIQILNKTIKSGFFLLFFLELCFIHLICTSFK